MQGKSSGDWVATSKRYPWSAAFNFPEITFLHYFLTLSPPRRFRWIPKQDTGHYLRSEPDTYKTLIYYHVFPQTLLIFAIWITI